MRKVLAMAALVLAFPMAAQAQFGFGAQANLPTGSFDRSVSTGFGVYAKQEFNFAVLGWAAEANYNQFGGKNGADATSIVGLQTGPRLNLGLIRFGVDYGYFTEIKESGVVSSMSFKLGPIEAGVNYTGAGNGQWLGLRGGFRF